MKTKPFVLFVALLLSLTLLAGKTLAQGAALPTVPKYFDPKDPSQPQPPTADAGDFPNPNGMNLNLIEVPLFPQTADTFVPVDEDEDLIGNPIVDPKLHDIVITQKDAVEEGAGEKTINIPQGYAIRINLKKTLVKATVSQGEHEWDNPWSFQQDNNNLHPFLWGGIFAFYQGDDKSQFSCVGGGKPGWMEISKQLNDCQKINITYFFKACSLGQATLTFNYESEPVPHHQPKTLTFHFNVVEAPAASDASASNNNEDASSEK